MAVLFGGARFYIEPGAQGATGWLLLFFWWLFGIYLFTFYVYVLQGSH